MGQSTHRGRRVWFWVAAALLTISALFWLILIFIMIDEPGDTGSIILTGVLLTGIPIGIGIYCLRRGRKAPAAEVQHSLESIYAGLPNMEPVVEAQKSIRNIQDSGSEIVIKMPWWFRVVAWGELLCGILLLLVGLARLPVGEMQDPGDMWFMVGFGVFFVLLGIWMVGMTTKVAFSLAQGDMTISRGSIPLFLWFLRTRRISREEARSVFVHSADRSVGGYGGTKQAYEVRVVARSGKEVKLYDGGWNQDKAAYLARRIRGFAR
jgi:hypothetical protein